MKSVASPVALDAFVTFGDLLRYLRRRARLTQLELSIAVGYSDAQITRLEKNQRLPDVTAVKALFIPALHLENEPELARRLLELARSARQQDAPAPGIPPYKGLLAFQERDSELFFGREALTAKLIERVHAMAAGSPPRLLAIVGASGSGKSSLLRAGLAVALEQNAWETHILTPSAQPLHALPSTTSGTDGPGNANSAPATWLIDQFEEVFTLCKSDAERTVFIDCLLDAANAPHGPTVVLTLRADFYSHCAQFPHLRAAIAAQQEYIGQMTAEEIRRAIEEPARRSGWELETGLLELLLRDLGAEGDQVQESGALPLLSHALLATWERRRGRTMTLDGYRASGGIRGAIAETAESVFTDSLNAARQQIARDIFLRLTELGEGTEDTRRRAAFTELTGQSQGEVVRTVLNTLADARLVSLNEDSAEVSHEALIREWQRLRDWLTQDREGLRLRRNLTEAAQEWESLNHDPGALYRGARLAQASEWASAHPEQLNDLERAFLSTSNEQVRREELEHEAQRQRELDAALKLAEAEKRQAMAATRTAAQLRGRAIFLAGAFLLAIIMASMALFLGNEARTSAATAQTRAQEAEAASKRAESERRIAVSRELSQAAINSLEQDPERSILLALQAVTTTFSADKTWTADAEDSLHRAVQSSRVKLTLRGHTDRVERVAYSPDGSQIVTVGDDKQVKVWDATTGQELRTFSGYDAPVYDAAIRSDGKRLVSMSSAGTGKVQDSATGQELLTWHTTGPIAVAISGDGTRVATTGADGKVQVWDTENGQEIFSLTSQEVNNLALSRDGGLLAVATTDKFVRVWQVGVNKAKLQVSADADAVALSGNGAYLATGNSDGTATVWDMSSGENVFMLAGHSNLINSLTFSRDSTRLATGALDGTAKIWDMSTGKLLLTLLGHKNAVEYVAFSPDGNRLATGSADQTARVWDISDQGGRELLTVTGNKGWVKKAVYSPDGTHLASASREGEAKIWDTRTGNLLVSLSGHTGWVYDIAYGPDGKWLVTAGEDGTARLWDAATGQVLLTLVGHGDGIVGGLYKGVLAAQFSPDGKRVATAGADGKAIIYDATTGQAILKLVGHQRGLTNVVYSHDGTRIATAGDDGLAIIWDAATGQELLKLNAHTDRLWGLAYSPDDRHLAASGFGGFAGIWDAASGQQVLTLSGHVGTVLSVAYSPDGKRVATAGTDYTRIWDATTGKELLSLTGHSSGVWSVSFSPDGNQLVTSSLDTTMRVYALHIEDLVALARTRVTRSLTADECQKYLHSDQCPASP